MIKINTKINNLSIKKISRGTAFFLALGIIGFFGYESCLKRGTITDAVVVDKGYTIISSVDGLTSAAYLDRQQTIKVDKYNRCLRASGSLLSELRVGDKLYYIKWRACMDDDCDCVVDYKKEKQ